MNLDEFMEAYLFPFEVRGKNLDDVEEIFFYYRELMNECSNTAELLSTASEFRFLAVDATASLKSLNEYPAQIADLTYKRAVELATGEGLGVYAPIVLPRIMLQAHMLLKTWGIPQYPAAVQYVAAMKREAEGYVNPVQARFEEHKVDAPGDDRVSD